MWEERGRQGERGERKEGKIPHSPETFILHCIKLYSPSSNARGGALPFLYKLEHSSRLLVVPTFLINPLSRWWKLFPGPVLDLTDLAVKVKGMLALWELVWTRQKRLTPFADAEVTGL